MTVQVPRQLYDSLPYDLDEAVAAHQQALADHAQSEGVPAPTAEPLVEQIVYAGGTYEIVEPPPPPLPPGAAAEAEAGKVDK